jgi:MHS family proline/betaine transporter-like MFS transporter
LIYPIYGKILDASMVVFVTSTALGPIPAFLSERIPTEIRNSASGFGYNGGMIIGSWSPLNTINLLSHTISS